MAAEAFVHAGYPLEAEAVLIVELDGCEAEVTHLVGLWWRRFRAEHGAAILPHQPERRGKIAVLVGEKSGFSGDRAAVAGLSVHGRHHSPPAGERGV